jgi:hypothetical protein
MRFPQQWLWRVSSFGIWRRVVCWVATDVSEEHIASETSKHIASIFRVEEIIQQEPAMKRRNISPPSSGRPYVPPKRRWQLNRLHGVISQKMILFYHDVFTHSLWFSALTSYSRGPGFEYLELFEIPLSHSKKMKGLCLKICCDRFSLHYFQFIIYNNITIQQ